MVTSDAKKQLLKLLLRIAVTVGLLSWVFQSVSLVDLRSVAAHAKWQYLALVCLFNVLLFWIRAFRSQLIFKRLDCPVGLPTLFGASAVMTLYGMVLPGVLSLAAKWQVLKRCTGKGSNVLSGMLYSQVSVMLVMLAFGLLALALGGPVDQTQMGQAGGTGSLYVATAVLLALVLVTYACMCSPAGTRLDALSNALIRRLPEPVARKVRTVTGQLAVFRTVGPRFHLTIASLTFVTGVMGGGLLLKLAAQSVSISVPALVFVWMYVLIYLLGRLPISLANCGVREFVLVGVLGAYGIDSSAALLMSVILFAAQLFLALIGALYQLSWSLQRNKNSHQ
ncbi:MAG: flippase-like domain-containing protein [Planctomycetes bacterium]|nr:flippase-like domain-containing protein [Planctomycetota bacterium]